MRRVLTPGWLAVHVLTATLVVGMLWLAGWQLARGMAGNTISWGYALQWPAFAGFVVFVWGRELRRTLRTRTGPGGATEPADAADPAGVAEPAGVATAAGPVSEQEPPRAGRPPGVPGRPVLTGRVARATGQHVPGSDPDRGGDPELVAYNRYLAWLNAHPGARPADYPG